MALSYVALGANLAQPETQIEAALAALKKDPELSLLRASSLYRSAPIGVSGQPDFINAVAALETSLAPMDLLNRLFALENHFGRRRDFHQAPRTLDLDLLLYDAQIVENKNLQIPHPRMHLRAFVLVPLLEVAPECQIPGRGKAAAWLPALSLQRMELIASAKHYVDKKAS